MERRGRVAAAVAVCLLLASTSFTFAYAVDDAYIVARHARNVANGHGLVMNVGGPRTDGVTEPVLLAPMVLGEAAVDDGILFAKLVGVACAVLASVLVVCAAAKRVSFGATVLAAVFVGASAPLAIAAVSGLGTTFAALLLTYLLLAALDGKAPAWRFGLVASLAWLSRPELVPTVALVVFVHARATPRSLRISLPLFLLGGLSVAAYRLSLFGHVVPLAALAKPLELGHGASYVLRAALASGAVTTCLGALVVGHRLAGDGRLVASVVVSHLVWVALAGGDWMPAYRLIVPIVPAIALLLALVAESARGTTRPRALVVASVVFASLAVVVLDASVNLPRAREAARWRTGPGRSLAAYLARNAHRVALVDAGYLPYASGVEVVDLAGLTDESIARRPGGHLDKQLTAADLGLREPDAILLHSSRVPVVDDEGHLLAFAGYPVELRVASFPFVRDEFRVTRIVDYAPDYTYLVLERRDAR